MKKGWIRIEPMLKSVAVALSVVAAGCDVELPSLRKAAEQVAKYTSEQMPNEPLTPTPVQVEGERASLEHYATSRRAILEAERGKVAKELAEIRADRQSLSQRVSEHSDKAYADKNAGLENALLLLLRDDIVNSLANKYLGGDFAIVRNDFVSKVREAYKLKKEREAALAESRKIYEEAVTSSADKDAMLAKSSEEELRKLESDIRDKERRIGYLRSMGMASSQEKKRRLQEIASLESEVRNMKRSLERMREKSRRNTSDSVKSRALRQFEASGKDIERRFKGIVSASEVAEEYENSTIKKLDVCMREMESKILVRKELQDAQITFISSLASGLEKLDGAGLRKVRKEIEQALLWTTEDARGKGFHVGQ